MMTYLVLYVLFVVIDIVSSVRLIKIRSPYMLIKMSKCADLILFRFCPVPVAQNTKKRKLKYFQLNQGMGYSQGMVHSRDMDNQQQPLSLHNL